MYQQYHQQSKTRIECHSEEATDHFKSSSNDSTCEFNCNICLDMVQDPVITFCGHLYCWPCIYRWIQSKTVSCEEPDQHCPVCHAEVSVNTMIPLYGRGHQSRESPHGKEVPQRPNRPPACGAHTLISATATTTRRSHDQHHRLYRGLAGTTTYDWIFRNTQSSMYRYTNTYGGITSAGNARIRRHEMTVDRSLSRVSFFLCCCVIVCLLSF